MSQHKFTCSGGKSGTAGVRPSDLIHLNNALWSTLRVVMTWQKIKNKSMKG